MPEFTAALVKELRDATNLGMMECKRALVEADGDKDKAVRILRERGLAVAQKKASRAAQQGIVASASDPGSGVFSLVEINCETDFAARNEAFVALASELATRACATDASLAETAAQEITDLVARIGENIVVRRNVRYTPSPSGAVGSYVHLGGKVGVLVELLSDSPESLAHPLLQEALKDVAMQIAASSPIAVKPSDLPDDLLKSEREVYAKQVQDKPPQVVEKIVDGKMTKFYTQTCLLNQPFIKEPKQSVSDYLALQSKELGGNLTVSRFVRYQLGEIV
jgi:elongation factor Ts